MNIQSKVDQATYTNTLNPYNGPWGDQEAKHLLKRTTYGPTRKMIKDSISKGMASTITELLTDLPDPDLPINYGFEDDPEVPIGETWVGKVLTEPNTDFYRRRSMRAWTIGLALNQGVSIREKMYMFWHNHFAISDINRSSYEYSYAELIRNNALGNFKELVKAMTIEPAMLRYLNGNQNTLFNPNENYARELLELFTIGKGPQVAPGDYTHYTEQDVVEIARVLTGWRDIGYGMRRGITVPFALYQDLNHDKQLKTLSARFLGKTISNLGNQEYEHLIDIIFEQDEVSRFITRKIYRWFVYHQIDEVVEQEVIEPLAQILRDANYEIKPMLEALFTSNYFYEETFRGAIIKSPLDYTIGMVHELELKPFNESPQAKFLLYVSILRVNELLEQSPFDLPDVAGWKAYYQEPQFYQLWINASTLQFLKVFRTMLLEGKVEFNGTLRVMPRLQADILKFVGDLDEPDDPNTLIDELTAFFFPQEITDGQKKALKDVLLPGLPDYEWTVEYNDHVANPGNEDYAAPIRNKLIELLQALTAMPEYYVS